MPEILTETFSFISPLLFLVVVPCFFLLVRELNNRKRCPTVALTDLEYMRSQGCVTGRSRQSIRIALWGVIVTLLGLLWAGPVLHTAAPVFAGGGQSMQKNLIVAIDISRSMGQPLKIPDLESRLSNYSANQQSTRDEGEQPSRYELARETFNNFVHRFEGARIGLILFSTEPFLARWPTVETDQGFIEVLEENIGVQERSQLQRLSSLTNIDKALRLTREVFIRQKQVRGGAVILISDAEDELENMGLAIRALRESGIRLYTIGVGISEIIADKLSSEFKDDPGFRIFHVDADEEMQEAYRLVSELEESPRLSGLEQEFITNLRWLMSMALVLITVAVVWLSETVFHQSLITGRKH
jgi:hypothetical protein